MKKLLVLLVSLALLGSSGIAQAQAPTLPACTDNGADHERWGRKNQDPPPSLAVTKSHEIDVSRMLNWIVPVNVSASAAKSDDPIGTLEKNHKLYALTGYVRLIKLETDCDFHVQVAQSADLSAPEVIVEIPRALPAVQQALMGLLAMSDGQQTKTWKTKPPPHVRFVGFPFLDQSHQSKPPTQEGHGHGPAGVVQTLWELHPVVKVEAAK